MRQKPKFDKKGRPRCFQCNAYGHFAAECYAKPAGSKTKAEVNWVKAFTQQKELDLVESRVDKSSTVCGTVGGQKCNNILLDTGATQTVVSRNLISPSSYTGRRKLARGFSGDKQFLLIARTMIQVDGDEHDLEVLVADGLSHDALLRRDVPELWEIGKHILYDDLIGMVSIRSSRIKQLQQLPSDFHVPESQKPTDSEESDVNDNDECPFDREGQVKYALPDEHNSSSDVIECSDDSDEFSMRAQSTVDGSKMENITPQKDEELTFTTATPPLQTKMLRLRENGSDQISERAGERPELTMFPAGLDIWMFLLKNSNMSNR